MNRWTSAALLVALTFACADADSHSVRPPSLVGTWRALEYVDLTESDSALRFPFG